MKRLLLSSALLVSTLYSSAQAIEIDSLFQKLKIAYEIFPGSVWGPNVAIADLPVTQEQVYEWFEVEGDAIYDSYDSISTDELYHHSYFDVQYYLGLFLKHPDLSMAYIDSLIGRKMLYPNWSDDKKLLNLLMEEGHGGTYRSSLSFLIYFKSETDFQVFLDPEMLNDIDFNEPPHIFHSDGYSSMELLSQAGESVYRLSGAVRGCGMCFGAFVQLVSFEGRTPKELFSYNLNLRTWEWPFTFNDSLGTMEVNYISDDLTYGCNCSEESTDETKEMEFASCYCKFELRNGTYELVEYKAKEVANPFEED